MHTYQYFGRHINMNTYLEKYTTNAQIHTLNYNITQFESGCSHRQSLVCPSGSFQEVLLACVPKAILFSIFSSSFSLTFRFSGAVVCDWEDCGFVNLKMQCTGACTTLFTAPGIAQYAHFGVFPFAPPI